MNFLQHHYKVLLHHYIYLLSLIACWHLLGHLNVTLDKGEKENIEQLLRSSKLPGSLMVATSSAAELLLQKRHWVRQSARPGRRWQR